MEVLQGTIVNQGIECSCISKDTKNPLQILMDPKCEFGIDLRVDTIKSPA